MKRYIALLAIACCCLFSTQLYSQDTKDSTYRVETVDGNEYIGKILSRDSSGITLKTEQLGVITLKSADVKRVSAIGAVKIENGRVWLDNPDASRYFISPSGYGVKKGQGYYQNVWIFFNQFTYGITNNFSIGAGIVPLFLFSGSPTPVWINPKLSIPIVKDKINLGVGFLAGTVLGEVNSGFGILYGVTTFGSRDRNISVGIGYGFAGDELAQTPTITLSGMYRIAPRWYLLTENYLIGLSDANLGILSFGGRYVTRKLGIDFGLFVPIEQDDGIFAGPWLGINVPFGRK